MRLWSIHPRYLDAKGLVALWREGLLAQAVLRGRTKGYTRHPQLERFRTAADPLASIATYLDAVVREASARGYRFDGTKLSRKRTTSTLAVPAGQIDYEWAHLRAKLATRDPARARLWRGTAIPDPHPLFRIVPGGIAPWERTGEARSLRNRSEEQFRKSRG